MRGFQRVAGRPVQGFRAPFIGGQRRSEVTNAPGNATQTLDNSP